MLLEALNQFYFILFFHRIFQSSSLSSNRDTSENIVYEEQIESVVSEQLSDYDTMDSVMFTNVFNKVQLHTSSSDQDIKFTGICV